MYIDENLVKSFFIGLNNAGINYVLIKNIANELPSKLKNGKDIDILVHPESQADFEKHMLQCEFEKVRHPLGRENGWSFGYCLDENQFWKNSKDDQLLYIDVSTKLPCKSLTPKMWIPLDETINRSVWENKIFDEKNGWWIMCDEDVFVYMIVRSVFDKHQFKAEYIQDIENKKFLLQSENVINKLSKVFFKYTDRLIQQITEKRYDTIFSDYISFCEY